MKTFRFLIAIFLVLAYFGIAAIDYFVPGPDSNWKTIALGVIYGCANIVIFVLK